MCSCIKKKENLEHLFIYHPPKGDQAQRYALIRSEAKKFVDILDICVPDSADKSAAIMKLRECVMLANAAIAVNE